MIDRVCRFLGMEVDNSSLILFRVCYGFLIASESFGAILTGWVYKVLVEPSFTFSFIDMEWLQPLPGNGMYIYFILMGTCGLLVMVGLFYRYASFLFFILWSGVYLMQKTSYNNHYYLLMLIAGVMVLMPANKSRSLDVKYGFTKPSDSCPNACIWFFIIHVAIIYASASLNKIHMDWLMAKPIGIWFNYKSNYLLVGSLLTQRWFQYAIAWGGVLYDGLIIFLLLYKPTRKLGFWLSILFNLFNSAIFQIGIFPYMMIAFTMFFFPPETIRKIFFKKKIHVRPIVKPPNYTLFWLFASYFVVQLWLPIRHHLYKGDVHWTEEGHRMAWQMMLRTKTGTAIFEVVDKNSGESEKIKLNEFLTFEQERVLVTEPDLIWQFAQYLKKHYAKRGHDISVFVDGFVSLNGHTKRRLVDPEVDIASVSWERWKHADWILTYDSYD